ncbi:MAG: hypothetical protein FD180_1096 [Planctomycetota bacterium]|nr:MAG: hypothetical protein FD180_1096 [Planctomycetota bacterium]
MRGGYAHRRMLQFLKGLPARLGLANADIWTVALIFVATLVGSLAIVTFLIVRMPADYFVRGRTPPGPTWKHVAAMLLKNLAGVVLVLVGVVLSLPGIPGQGVLTILVGLMLTDIPGVRALERWIVRRAAVKRALDAIRRRFGKAPLEVL